MVIFELIKQKKTTILCTRRIQRPTISVSTANNRRKERGEVVKTLYYRVKKTVKQSMKNVCKKVEQRELSA